MKMFSQTKAFTYDDVALIPRLSNIDSRGGDDVDISTDICGLHMTLPVMSANMDSVTEDTMCEIMHQCGGIGILHRFTSDSNIISWVEHLREKEIPFGGSIGANRDDDHLLRLMVGKGVNIICIDAAHGHHIKVRQRIKYIKSFNKSSLVMAGNVCTYDGAAYLADAGADIVKVGVSNGSHCTTRLATGCGMPQVTALSEAFRIKADFPDVAIVADGGIRNPGDVVKALALGADAVMIGKLLAGTKASPGGLVRLGTFGAQQIFKNYRGSASMACKSDHGREARFIEGTSSLVPYTGKAEDILTPIADGLKSALSYQGARTLKELRDNAVFVELTPYGYIEGTPHGASHTGY